MFFSRVLSPIRMKRVSSPVKLAQPRTRMPAAFERLVQRRGTFKEQEIGVGGKRREAQSRQGVAYEAALLLDEASRAIDPSVLLERPETRRLRRGGNAPLRAKGGDVGDQRCIRAQEVAQAQPRKRVELGKSVEDEKVRKFLQ